jgi:hypothetical protein
VLALLDKNPGVEASRVDHSGRFILLTLESDADEARVGDEACAQLHDAHRVATAKEVELVRSYQRGDPWLRAADTIELSREEARIMAHRRGVAAAQEIGLDGERAEKLTALIERELVAAFEEIHARGKGLDDASRLELRNVGAKVVEKSRDFLTAEEARRFESYVAEQLESR